VYFLVKSNKIEQWINEQGNWQVTSKCNLKYLLIVGSTYLNSVFILWLISTIVKRKVWHCCTAVENTFQNNIFIFNNIIIYVIGNDINNIIIIDLHVHGINSKVFKHIKML
jgi:hypothetical protein